MIHPAPIPSESAQPPEQPDFAKARAALDRLMSTDGSPNGQGDLGLVIAVSNAAETAEARITELTAKVDEYHLAAYRQDHLECELCERWQGSVLSAAESRLSLLEAQNAELRASLKEARADSERMDLLNSRGSEFEGMTAATPPRETVWFFKSAKYTDLRAFADAARGSR